MHLVSQTLRSVTHPIHVQKITLPGNSASICELSKCLDVKKTAARSFRPSFECDHVQSVCYEESYLPNVKLRNDSLNCLVKRHLFSESRRTACIAHRSKAVSANCPVAVSSVNSQLTPAGSRYVFFSVFANGVHYWGRLSQTVVCLDAKPMKWTCRCSASQQKGCIHRAVAKWLCHQEHSYLMWSEKTSDSEYLPEQESKDETSEEHSRSLYCYPPQGHLLRKMLDYLKQYKSILLAIDNRLALDTPKLTQYMPSETTCKFCSGVQLEGPLTITTKGKVIALDQIVESKRN